MHSENLVGTGHSARPTLWGHRVAPHLGSHLSKALWWGGELRAECLEATQHSGSEHRVDLLRSPGFAGTVVNPGWSSPPKRERGAKEKGMFLSADFSCPVQLERYTILLIFKPVSSWEVKTCDLFKGDIT